MLRMDQVHVLRHKVLNEGQSIRRVARELGLSRNTVAKYLSNRNRCANAGPVLHQSERACEEWVGISNGRLAGTAKWRFHCKPNQRLRTFTPALSSWRANAATPSLSPSPRAMASMSLLGHGRERRLNLELAADFGGQP
jgi:hypothetical protein